MALSWAFFHTQLQTMRACVRWLESPLMRGMSFCLPHQQIHKHSEAQGICMHTHAYVLVDTHEQIDTQACIRATPLHLCSLCLRILLGASGFFIYVCMAGSPNSSFKYLLWAVCWPNGRRRHSAWAGHTSIIAFQISDTVTRMTAALGANSWKGHASFMKDFQALFTERVTITFSVQVKYPVW